MLFNGFLQVFPKVTVGECSQVNQNLTLKRESKNVSFSSLQQNNREDGKMLEEKQCCVVLWCLLRCRQSKAGIIASHYDRLCRKRLTSYPQEKTELLSVEMPVPVELWIPDQDWLESTEMTVGQSEWPEAADVCELHRKDKRVVRLKYSLFHHVSCTCTLKATVFLYTCGNIFSYSCI